MKLDKCVMEYRIVIHDFIIIVISSYTYNRSVVIYMYM